jgi:Flp pilus assembly protein CpaB
MAVPVTAGHHQLQLRYRPRLFLAGLALSAATLLGLLGALAWRRRASAPPAVPRLPTAPVARAAG